MKGLKASRTRGEWLIEQAEVVEQIGLGAPTGDPAEAAGTAPPSSADGIAPTGGAAVEVQPGGSSTLTDVFKLTLRAPEIARRAVAGQFVMVGCAPANSTAVDPLLRRPFSICQIRPEEGTISLIYRVVGRGTQALSAFEAGVRLEVMGPLGHSFPDPGEGKGLLVLVGGGLGIPPMVAAAERAAALDRSPGACPAGPAPGPALGGLTSDGATPAGMVVGPASRAGAGLAAAGRPVTAIVGARTARYLAGAEELRATGVPVTVMTDDGSAGQRGLVTAPLKQLLDLGTVGEVWACGPEPMLAAVKELCAARNVPCFVSVERHMACGFGACLGCTVPEAGESGYYKTCQDGPVFLAEEVELGGF